MRSVLQEQSTALGLGMFALLVQRCTELLRDTPTGTHSKLHEYLIGQFCYLVENLKDKIITLSTKNILVEIPVSIPKCF